MVSLVCPFIAPLSTSMHRSLMMPKGKHIPAAAAIGKAVGERALKKGLKTVVFDRGGFMYHGRVKALADAAREAGLEF
jgi:large subunit ribosomal protein L18